MQHTRALLTRVQTRPRSKAFAMLRHRQVHHHRLAVRCRGLNFRSHLGSLRWKAPQAPAQMKGVQNATSPPNICPQASEGISPTNPFTGVSGLAKRATAPVQSEDCLFLKLLLHVNSEVMELTVA